MNTIFSRNLVVPYAITKRNERESGCKSLVKSLVTAITMKKIIPKTVLQTLQELNEQVSYFFKELVIGQ